MVDWLTRPDRKSMLFMMADSTQIRRNLRAAMKEALRIQDRFVPEPVFARTGKGYLKSEGSAPFTRSKPICAEKPPLKGHEQTVAEGLALGNSYCD